MERLTQKQQAELTKMSNDRLRMKLARVGIDEEAIATAERPELLNMYAEYLLLPPGAVGGGTTTLSEEELALRRSELARREKEVELREKELTVQSEMKQQELTVQMEMKQKELTIQSELKQKELELRELEMDRQRRKDEAEQKRKESLAGQTKFYGDALKYSLPKTSPLGYLRHNGDVCEYPSYFQAVENIFAMYEVPRFLQSKLLIPMLNERSKSLLARLPKEQLDDVRTT